MYQMANCKFCAVFASEISPHHLVHQQAPTTHTSSANFSPNAPQLVLKENRNYLDVKFKTTKGFKILQQEWMDDPVLVMKSFNGDCRMKLRSNELSL